MKLSIVIPALNEEETIAIVIKKAFHVIDRMGLDAEVVVSDNGSTDATYEIAQANGARIVCVPERGYGRALQSGFAAARGDYVLMADADDSYGLDEIKPYIDKLDEGYDIVIGNRYKGKTHNGAMPFLHRYLGTPILTFFLNVLFQTRIGDVNCGMRACRKDVFEKMHCTCSGMEFASEMMIKAAQLKLKIADIPCNYYPDKRNRPSHLQPWRDGWRHLSFIVRSFIKGA